MSSVSRSSRLAKYRYSAGPLMPMRLATAFGDSADTPVAANCSPAY